MPRRETAGPTRRGPTRASSYQAKQTSEPYTPRAVMDTTTINRRSRTTRAEISMRSARLPSRSGRRCALHLASTSPEPASTPPRGDSSFVIEGAHAVGPTSPLWRIQGHVPRLGNPSFDPPDAARSRAGGWASSKQEAVVRALDVAPIKGERRRGAGRGYPGGSMRTERPGDDRGELLLTRCPLASGSFVPRTGS